MVLRSGVRSDDDAGVFGRSLSGPLLESRVFPSPVDAFHALLSLVSTKSAPQVEGAGFQRQLPVVRLGRVQVVLGLLPLVREAIPGEEKIAIVPWVTYTIQGH